MTAAGSLTVRDATDRDLPRIAEIKVRNWLDTYASLVPTDVLTQYVDEDAQLAYLRGAAAAPGALMLVAEASGQVIGFALTYAGATPEPWLESLHVLQGFRSAGAGAALMRETAARLRATGHRSLRLGVVAGNHAAMRFYEKLDGVHDGSEPTTWAPAVMHEIYRWPDLAALG